MHRLFGKVFRRRVDPAIALPASEVTQILPIACADPAAARFELAAAPPIKPVDLARNIHRLSTAGEHDAAEDAAEAALASHPADLGVTVAAAYVAHRRGDWPVAAQRWESVRSAFPSVLDAHVHAARAWYMQGRHETAKTILDHAERVFPERKLVVLKCQAYAAEARLDWQGAVEFWRTARSLAEDDAEAKGALARTQYKLNEKLADEAAYRLDVASNMADDAERSRGANLSTGDAADLLMRFESLGGNCELGLVQRHFQAEPVGLFRFGGITIAKLTEGLRAGFPGLGDPENTEFTHTSDGCYDLRDLKHNIFLTHTHVKIGSVDEPRFFIQQCRRVRFLKDKLFEDLRAAEKIFVFKPEKGHVSDDEILNLHAVMRSYGPNTLLCMRTADATHAAGTIIQLRQDVYIGHLGTVWDNVIPIEFKNWLAMCRSVHETVGVVHA